MVAMWNIDVVWCGDKFISWNFLKKGKVVLNEEVLIIIKCEFYNLRTII